MLRIVWPPPLLASVTAFAAIGLRLGVEQTRHDVGSDTRYYVAWGEQAHKVGPLRLYSVSDDESRARWQRHAMNYGPLFDYVWAQNVLRRAMLGAAPYYHPLALLALLVPVALCYVAVGYTLREILEPRLGAAPATTAALLYWLSPGIVMNSAYHGQADVFICLVMLISLASLPVPPIWLTGTLCATAVMASLTLLRFRLGRLSAGLGGEQAESLVRPLEARG